MMVTVALRSSGRASTTAGSGSLSWALCLLFRNNSLLVAAAYASQAGLVVITVERYFLVVHPIAHRAHFRAWMVGVGVAAPWINGILIYLVPIWSTTRFVGPGLCLGFFSWPSAAAADVYVIGLAVWQFAIPICVFAICYGRIVTTIRRQESKINSFGIRLKRIGERWHAIVINNYCYCRAIRPLRWTQTSGQRTCGCFSMVPRSDVPSVPNSSILICTKPSMTDPCAARRRHSVCASFKLVWLKT